MDSELVRRLQWFLNFELLNYFYHGAAIDFFAVFRETRETKYFRRA